MASVPTYMPNPYGNFDPSQYTNPYSSFQSSGIPFPASYAGWPTDANGNPIRMPPGMTLNNTPAQPAPAAAAAPQGPVVGGNPILVGGGQNMSYINPAAGVVGYGPQPGNGVGWGGASGGNVSQPAAPAAPAPAAGPGGLTAQQYLQLRANPGYIATPGATVPQSQTSYQPGSGVLQAFLQNWQPAQSGVGSQFQQQFAKALGKGS
jgi:hypothetical protein